LAISMATVNWSWFSSHRVRIRSGYCLGMARAGLAGQACGVTHA
jgi:hypothetical protein